MTWDADDYADEADNERKRRKENPEPPDQDLIATEVRLRILWDPEWAENPLTWNWPALLDLGVAGNVEILP